MRMWLLVLALATTTGSLLGCSANLVTVKQDFALNAPWKDFERVIVRTRNGRVELSATDRQDISIVGTQKAGGLTHADARANLERLTIVAEPDHDDPATFLIELKVPKPLRNKNAGAGFVIQLPEPCAAEVLTGNGAIFVEHLESEIMLCTSNGRIVVADVAGNVEVVSSNGGVEAARVSGNLRAHTSNGSIEARAVGGSCALTTSNGSVRVTEAEGDIKVVTSNGRIEVDASPPDEAEIVLRTSNGSIHATLPERMKADVSLNTSNGRVYAEMDRVTLTRPRWSRHHFEAALNGGGGKIVARTSNGSVTLQLR